MKPRSRFHWITDEGGELRHFINLTSSPFQVILRRRRDWTNILQKSRRHSTNLEETGKVQSLPQKLNKILSYPVEFVVTSKPAEWMRGKKTEYSLFCNAGYSTGRADAILKYYELFFNQYEINPVLKCDFKNFFFFISRLGNRYFFPFYSLSVWVCKLHLQILARDFTLLQYYALTDN